jgi:hypothetical protein
MTLHHHLPIMVYIYHADSFTYGMWTWMHKNIHRINAPYISEEVYREFSERQDGITQIVVDAVAQYNEMSQLSEHFEGKGVNERLIKEAEEEAAKVFLDGILDIVQRRNS